ncbi:Alpha/Beta hydrolase protein [Xylariomycetidae sp. FL2044]|nr:Alpha/Beta hydrolase protein [Xylariomycetidae sp. FL2044]
MQIVKKTYVETSLGQVHYRYTPEPGSRQFPILFLHMSASSSACFEELMRTYAGEGYQCFAPDMPGFGQSFDPTPDPPAISWYVELYLGIFQALPAFSRGCHIFGHHSGAVIGTEFAVLYPEFVKSLILEGPAIMEKEQREALRKTSMVSFNKPVPDGTHWLKTWEYLLDHGGMSREELDLLQQETLDHGRAWKGRLQIYNCVWNHDGPTLFKKVQCPILAMCARDDVLWDHFGKIQELRPEVPAEEIKGANFGPSRDVRGISRLLTPFLEKVGSA